MTKVVRCNSCGLVTDQPAGLVHCQMCYGTNLTDITPKEIEKLSLWEVTVAVGKDGKLFEVKRIQ